MVNSKSNYLAPLPKEQRSHFIIGPLSSWFMPSISDLWSQPISKETTIDRTSQDAMECEQHGSAREILGMSYFIYGSIGCFCYGEVHHNSTLDVSECRYRTEQPNLVTATVTRLINIKEDNSRVSCVRFLKTALHPFAMVLTENGSLLIHNCVKSENIVHYNRSELIKKFNLTRPEDTNGGHCNKKPKFDVTQQINSCVWPNATNAFMAVSLLKEKTNLLFWLKLKDITKTQANDSHSITKADLIVSHQKLELNLPQYSSPICCMESIQSGPQTCLIAMATDDGLITVVKVDFEKGQTNRVIKLARHNDQICSMSFFMGNEKKFPMGLLASASRNGLVLIWDIENEFYFADYLATSDNGRSRINWFTLSFVPLEFCKTTNLAVSNLDGRLTVLELPENTRSKTRLKETKDKQKKSDSEQTLRHHSLIFNVVFDPTTETFLTSSLDSNHILWKCQRQELSIKNKKDGPQIEIEPRYLLPSMANNSRTHMLRHSPIREDLLGMALGKAGLRFYKIAESPKYHRFDMTPSYSLIARKVTKASLSPVSLSWHPCQEYKLAVGTLEGKVLRIDLTPRRATMVEAEHSQVPRANSANNSREGDIFGVEYQPLERAEIDAEGTGNDDSPQKQPKTDGVYSLCWGPNPICPQDISRAAIYAVGSISRRLFIYYSKKETSDRMTNYLDEFSDQSLPEAIGQASEVSWKSGMDLMALGTTTGKIIIASYLSETHSGRAAHQLFVRLAVIQGDLGSTYVQCLAWHPTTDKDDPHYYHIAASANESPVFIFNINENLLVADVESRLKIDDGKIEQFAKMTSNIISDHVYKLDAHKKAISDIAWNPHTPNELATASFDRCCYVWSLDESLERPTKAHVIARFSARDRLFTLDWSLVERDLIYTSGHDSTVWAWRPSENCLQGNT